MSAHRVTRRDALAAGALGFAGLVAGCGGSSRGAGRPGSSLARALADPDGDGLLTSAPGVPLLDRTDLAGGTAGTRGRGRPLATLAQLTDVHVRDAQSPARVAFLDRLGPRFGSAFRPHEALTAQLLAGAVASIDAARPDAVLVSGDIVDSAQRNELGWALTLLTGGSVRADSGRRGYEGVQAASSPDPLFYRPDLDAPRHPGLLDRAVAPVRCAGLRAPWYPALGNHDVLVQGAIAPTAATRAVATGSRMVVAPDRALLELGRGGRLSRSQIDALLQAGLPGRSVRVSPDADRVQLAAEDVVARLRRAARGRADGAGSRLDYAFAVGDAIQVIVLDLVRRDEGAEGLVTAETVSFLRDALREAGDRWIVVCCHQPLHESEGAAAALALLDADRRVLAVVAGHRHRNVIVPRRSAAGGYWLITTASLIDFPQQWRALRVVETGRGRVALETWLVDHPGRPNDPGDLAGIARDLAFLDAQGGRPAGAAGRRLDRNVRLHLPPRERRAPPRRAGGARPGRPAQVPTPPPSAGLGDNLG
jgi:metallophosphoesterase (TIGR03767 family)